MWARVVQSFLLLPLPVKYRLIVIAYLGRLTVIIRRSLGRSVVDSEAIKIAPLFVFAANSQSV